MGLLQPMNSEDYSNHPVSRARPMTLSSGMQYYPTCTKQCRVKALTIQRDLGSNLKRITFQNVESIDVPFTFNRSPHTLRSIIYNQLQIQGMRPIHGMVSTTPGRILISMDKAMAPEILRKLEQLFEQMDKMGPYEMERITGHPTRPRRPSDPALVHPQAQDYIDHLNGTSKAGVSNSLTTNCNPNDYDRVEPHNATRKTAGSRVYPAIHKKESGPTFQGRGMQPDSQRNLDAWPRETECDLLNLSEVNKVTVNQPTHTTNAANNCWTNPPPVIYMPSKEKVTQKQGPPLRKIDIPLIVPAPPKDSPTQMERPNVESMDGMDNTRNPCRDTRALFSDHDTIVIDDDEDGQDSDGPTPTYRPYEVNNQSSLTLAEARQHLLAVVRSKVDELESDMVTTTSQVTAVVDHVHVVEDILNSRVSRLIKSLDGRLTASHNAILNTHKDQVDHHDLAFERWIETQSRLDTIQQSQTDLKNSIQALTDTMTRITLQLAQGDPPQTIDVPQEVTTSIHALTNSVTEDRSQTATRLASITSTLSTLIHNQESFQSSMTTALSNLATQHGDLTSAIKSLSSHIVTSNDNAATRTQLSMDNLATIMNEDRRAMMEMMSRLCTSAEGSRANDDSTHVANLLASVTSTLYTLAANQDGFKASTTLAISNMAAQQDHLTIAIKDLSTSIQVTASHATSQHQSTLTSMVATLCDDRTTAMEMLSKVSVSMDSTNQALKDILKTVKINRHPRSPPRASPSTPVKKAIKRVKPILRQQTWTQQTLTLFSVPQEQQTGLDPCQAVQNTVALPVHDFFSSMPPLHLRSEAPETTILDHETTVSAPFESRPTMLALVNDHRFVIPETCTTIVAGNPAQNLDKQGMTIEEI